MKNKTSSQKEEECHAHPTLHFCETEVKSAHHLSTKLVVCLNNCSERKAGKHKRKKNLLGKETSRNHQCHSNWIHLAQSRASFSCSSLETFISKSPTTMIPDKNKKKGLTDLRELTSTAGDIVLLCTSDIIINRIEILLVLKKIQVETNLVIHHCGLVSTGEVKWNVWHEEMAALKPRPGGSDKKSASKKK